MNGELGGISLSNTLEKLACSVVAEWSKALDLGSSLWGGVGSNPTTLITSEQNYDLVLL